MGQSRNEDILENILGADNEIGEPQSRNEKILQNILGASYPLDEPQSRIEELLMQILDQGLGKDEITLNATENGTYNAPDGKVYNPVKVNVDIYAEARKIISGNDPITEIPNEMFTVNNMSIRAYAFANCVRLTDVDLPDSKVTGLGDHAFYRCVNLVTFKCSASIGDYCFYNCTKLKSVLIRKNFYPQYIGDYAFKGCSQLEILDVGNLQNRIKQDIFDGCTSLATVIFRKETNVPANYIKAESNTFAHLPATANVYVPDTMVDTYKTMTGWDAVASQIKPLSEYVEE